jgi:geranylgeranyl diphosphate synthase type II
MNSLKTGKTLNKILLDYIGKTAKATEETLEKLLTPGDVFPQSIHQVMRYSVFAGGKRIRPCLLMASYEACGGSFGDENPLLACAAFEMLHTFSLIHDDLPCMDDDDFRRGKPTAHKAYGEAVAVLGGDALCIHAFGILARTGRIDIINEISEALGTFGMIGGQVVDMESEGKKAERSTVEYIHEKKTAAFIRAAVRTGAILAGAPQPHLNSLSSYGIKVGLAFQVVDDILDEEGTTEQLGKDAGSDRENQKATFPAVIGLEASKAYARDLIDEAGKDVDFLGGKSAMLKELALYIRTRIS